MIILIATLRLFDLCYANTTVPKHPPPSPYLFKLEQKQTVFFLFFFSPWSPWRVCGCCVPASTDRSALRSVIVQLHSRWAVCGPSSPTVHWPHSPSEPPQCPGDPLWLRSAEGSTHSNKSTQSFMLAIHTQGPALEIYEGGRFRKLFCKIQIDFLTPSENPMNPMKTLICPMSASYSSNWPRPFCSHRRPVPPEGHTSPCVHWQPPCAGHSCLSRHRHSAAPRVWRGADLSRWSGPPGLPGAGVWCPVNTSSYKYPNIITTTQVTKP